ncbi:hypothetical protein VTK56DRAFT_6661 [Thermocarpiscus australiensis]
MPLLHGVYETGIFHSCKTSSRPVTPEAFGESEIMSTPAWNNAESEAVGSPTVAGATSPAGDPRLCGKCRTIFERLPQVGRNLYFGTLIDCEDIRHWDTIQELKASAAQGCRLCILFVHGLRESDPGWTYFGPIRKDYQNVGIVRAQKRESQAKGEKVSEEEKMWPATWDLNLHVPAEVVKHGNGIFSFVELKRLDDPDISSYATPYHGYSPGRNTKDFDLIRHWLGVCTKTHRECEPRTPTIPTRLIEIEGASQRLRLTSDLSASPRYATLSHCWGKVVPFRLVQDNHSALRRDIPTSKLSKTFQHAIEITRELGLRYLWIDSLCIIQDSVSDWESEAAKMGDVYGDSFLTIMAASAADGSVGCFFDRDPLTVSMFKVLMGPSSGRQKPYGCIPGKLYQDCVTVSHLAKRAWCLQERYLSHRKIFFSDKQLFWQCRASIACETFPNGTDLYERDFHHGSWEEWWRTVQMYSMTDITYKTDRLIAFSGVAQRSRRAFASEYYAGLWQRDMPRQLLWATFDTGGPRQGPYAAPSWSWASAHRMIYFPAMGRYHPPRIRVDSVDLVPKMKDNPYGQVVSATLGLICLPMVRGYRRGSGWHPAQLEKGLWEANEVSYSEGPVYFLTVLEALEGDEIVGLCLEPTGLAAGQFQRVGMFRVIGVACDSYKALMTEGGEFVAEESVYGGSAAWDGDGQGHKCYKITIV